MKKAPVVITLTLGQVPFACLGSLTLMALGFAAFGFKVIMWGI